MLRDGSGAEGRENVGDWLGLENDCDGRDGGAIAGREKSGERDGGIVTPEGTDDGLMAGRMLRELSLRMLSLELDGDWLKSRVGRREGVIDGASDTDGDWNERFGVVTVWRVTDSSERSVGVLQKRVGRLDSVLIPPPIAGSPTGTGRV